MLMGAHTYPSLKNLFLLLAQDGHSRLVFSFYLELYPINIFTDRSIQPFNFNFI